MLSKAEFFRRLYAQELTHMHVYRGMERLEGRGHIRDVLSRLASLEEKHALMWKRVVDGQRELDEYRESLPVALMLAMRKVLGLALIIKLLERSELALQKEVTGERVMRTCSEKERHVIREVLDDRRRNEDRLQASLVEHNPVLTNIRDVIFGMNDGLVELVAATAGLGVVLQSALLIFVGGLIVAVSGTLSMAAGAYLSTEYESSIMTDSSRKQGRTTPKKSAAYVGLSYLLGTAFPLMPFALGIGGYPGVALSLAVTAITLAAVSALISVISDTSILKRMTMSVGVSMSSAAATIALGLFARFVLHLTI